MNEHFVLEIRGQIGSKIPVSVLVDILGVYEKGKEEDLKKIPNSLICDPYGNFWTSWEEIFIIRSQIKKWVHREILFRRFAGDE